MFYVCYIPTYKSDNSNFTIRYLDYCIYCVIVYNVYTGHTALYCIVTAFHLYSVIQFGVALNCTALVCTHLVPYQHCIDL